MPDSSYKRFLEWGLALLLVFTPVAQGAVKVWFSVPALLLINLLIFVWLRRWNNGNSYAPVRTPLDAPIAIFVLLAMLSFFFSIYRNASFYALLKVASFTGLYYLISSNFDDGMMRRMTFLVTALAGALSLCGLLQYADIMPHPWWATGKFLAATYVNHNHFAGYLELAIPAAIITFLEPGGTPKTKIFSAIALSVMFSAFILAQSRGAWLSLALSLLAMMIILIRRNISKKAEILLVLLLMASVSLFLRFQRQEVSERLETMAEVKTGEASWGTRLKIWQGSLEMARLNPVFGTGIGTFESGFSRFRPQGLLTRANFAHNDYLQATAEMGVLTPCVLAWMAIVILKRGLKKYSNLANIGYTMGVLSLFLHGFVDFNFHITANMLLCIVWIAFIMRSPARGIRGDV